MSLVDADTLPTPDAVLGARLDGVLVYIRQTAADQVAGFHAVGLAVGLIAEFDTRKPPHHPILDGSIGGKANGTRAAAQLRTMGAPAGARLTVWVTADTDVPPAQFATCAAYCQAFAAQVPGFDVGIYGGADLCDFLVTNGHAVRSWVAGATSWSHGHTSTTACLFQHASGSPLPKTDLDTYLNGHSVETCGLWLAHPIPKPTKADDDMVTLFMAQKHPGVYLLSANGCGFHIQSETDVANHVAIAKAQGVYVDAATITTAKGSTTVVGGETVWIVSPSVLANMVRNLPSISGRT